MQKHLLFSLLFVGSLHSTQYTVTIEGDANPLIGGTQDTSTNGDLRYCINAFNYATMGSSDTVSINFDIGTSTIQLQGILPPLNLFNDNTLTIDGGSQIIIDGDSTYRGLFVNQVTTPATVAIQNLTIQNCNAQGGSGSGGGAGMGGALFIRGGDVSLSNVSFSDNKANGGSSTGEASAGGGGLGGNGGAGIGGGNPFSGGGGGFSGNGGSVASAFATNGGGGGLANGGNSSADGAGGGGGGGALLGAAVGGQGFGNDDGSPGQSETLFPLWGGGGGGSNAGSGGSGAGNGGDGENGGINGDNGGLGGGGGGGGYQYVGNGGNGGAGGGGGGGGSNGLGGSGGDFAGGGGGGSDGSGSYTGGSAAGYGGGGGGPGSGNGGPGGFGGGGGDAAPGNNGGFGGGGGGSVSFGDGSALGGTGGGNNGGGGGGLGGAIFVDAGTLTFLENCSINGSSVTAGLGSTPPTNNGAAAAGAIFVNTGTLIFAPGTGVTQTINDPIGDASSNTLPGGSYQPGSGSGTGITKNDLGTLVLNGINTYIGTTTVSNGTLSVNGSIDSPVIVQSSALLKGTGQINSDVIISDGGLLAPGNSIGTITVGDLFLTSGSASSFDISPTENSKIVITDALTVDGPSVIKIVPESGIYPIKASYTLMTFANETGASEYLSVTDLGSLYQQFSLSITPDAVILDLTTSAPPQKVLPGYANAVSVTNAITKILSNGSDSAAFDDMLAQLFILTEAQYTVALNQMQPSLFKGLGISQQNNIVRVEESLGSRLQVELDEVHCLQMSGTCQNEKKKIHLWAEGYGDTLKQKSIQFAGSPQASYNNTMGGGTLGCDVHFAKVLYAGVLGAYTGSDIHWKKNQGSGDIQSGYAGVYLSALGKLFYANLSAVGGWTNYQAHRNIIYTGVSARSSNKHHGKQLLSHIDTGLNLGIKGFTIRPFDSFDYVATSEGGFTETGGGVYNLKINKTHTDFLRNELGINFASCLCFSKAKWTLSPKVSWVREVRVGGHQYTSEFAGTGVPFTVTGYVPDRSLLGLGVLVSGQMLNDLLSLDLYYNGEFGSAYSNSSYGGGLRFGF